jgi:integrase
VASIRKRRTADGEFRYDVRYRIGDGDRFAVATFRRRKDAEHRVRQVEADALTGTLIDPSLGRELLTSYAEAWLGTRLVRGRPLSPMTRQGYEGLLRRNIAPILGALPLARITPDAVRSWYADVTAEASTDQAAKSYRLLRAILNTAVEDDRIARNPCRMRGAGTERADERPMVDTDLVLTLAEAIDDRLRAFVLLAGFAGLRTGELLGLRRTDIDLLHGHIEVRVQAQEVARRGRVVSDPKSDAGRRTIALPTLLKELLEIHLGTYAQPGRGGVLFTSADGQPMTRRRLSIRWRAACRAVGAPPGLRIHDLRHHAATLTARMPGITTKELMARIGHSSPRAALIYQHATRERDRNIADYLDDAIASTDRSRPNDVSELRRHVE